MQSRFIKMKKQYNGSQMVGKVNSSVVTTGSLHVWRSGAGEGGDAVWVAVASGGRVASIGSAATWSLHKHSTGPLKVAIKAAIKTTQ